MQVDYPFSLGRHGRTATTSEDEHIRDLIEQVLFTTPGERVESSDLWQRLAAVGLCSKQ